MGKYNKLIFVCMDNSCSSPVAEAIMKAIKRDEWLTVQSRGLIVLFPEPYNPKAYSLLRNNGIILENGTSALLTEEDMGEDVLILTMDREQKNKILQDFEKAQNVYTIMEFAGGSGDIVDPYGGEAQLYSMFFESIKEWVVKVEEKLHIINNNQEDKQ